jgi:hypothetical protein
MAFSRQRKDPWGAGETGFPCLCVAQSLTVLLRAFRRKRLVIFPSYGARSSLRASGRPELSLPPGINGAGCGGGV